MTAEEKKLEAAAQLYRYVRISVRFTLGFALLIVVDRYLPQISVKEPIEEAYLYTGGRYSQRKSYGVSHGGSRSVETPHYSFSIDDECWQHYQSDDSLILGVTPVLRVVKEIRLVNQRVNLVSTPVRSIYQGYMGLEFILLGLSLLPLLYPQPNEFRTNAGIFAILLALGLFFFR